MSCGTDMHTVDVETKLVWAVRARQRSQDVVTTLQTAKMSNFQKYFCFVQEFNFFSNAYFFASFRPSALI